MQAISGEEGIGRTGPGSSLRSAPPPQLLTGGPIGAFLWGHGRKQVKAGHWRWNRPARVTDEQHLSPLPNWQFYLDILVLNQDLFILQFGSIAPRDDRK